MPSTVCHAENPLDSRFSNRELMKALFVSGCPMPGVSSKAVAYDDIFVDHGCLLSTACWPRSVRIVEVSPRDGLQNEAHNVDTATKIGLIHNLVDAGLNTVEVTGFVSRRWVPQLADASAVLNGVCKQRDVSYPVLVPNLQGLKAALAAGASEVSVLASASDTFSRRNVNCSLQHALDRCASIAAVALARGLKVRAYLSCIAGCPYEGDISPDVVAQVAVALRKMGCYEISLGDTIGAGTPRLILRVVDAIIRRGVPVSALAIHCHDTRGNAISNVLAALSRGVSVVDASVAGLGGCPFAPGAPGNLPTEDIVCVLRSMGIDVGPINLDKLILVGKRMCAYLKRESSARLVTFASDPSSPISETRRDAA